MNLSLCSHWSDRLYWYTRLVRAHRPIGALLLMWPMLWALWFVAAGQPDFRVLLVFVAGTFIMRSAGCAMNDFADRHIDADVTRTRDRPIVNGKVTPREALLVAGSLAVLSFVLVLSMNQLTIALSVVGVVLAAAYPFSKRYVHWPQFVLGLAFGWAVPMVVAAQTGQLGHVAWVIYFAAIVWALAYDTIYAMVDREDDLKLGVKSLAILLGTRDVAVVAVLQLVVLATVAIVGWQHGLGWLFVAGLVVAAAIAAYQIQLISSRCADRCFRAFLLNNYMGGAIFVGVAGSYLLSA